MNIASKYFKKSGFALFIGSLLLLSACNKDNTTYTSSSVPSVTVNISININSSLYTALLTGGNTLYLTGGYRGIVLYRLNVSTIMAFDRTCTYNISDAGGIVYSQNNGTAVCIDCGSTYNLANGNVISGPSTLGLKTYNVSFNSSTGAVTITN